MSREDFLRDYWKYYMMLENKFMASLNFVMLSTENYGTYSLEFVNQLFTIGSELDVVMKMISGFSETERKNISDYAPIILSKFTELTNQEVKVQGLDCPIKPFANWNTAAPGDIKGWEAYNKVKHGRVANLKEAKLENVLNLLACIYVLERMYLKEIADETGDIDIPESNSALFELKNWTSRYLSAKDLVLEEIGDAVVLNGGGAED
ncbi:MAG: hypothetical protein K2K60_03495 [Clostridia bacterium]|nr:hypothetical protein [Clostridia bacterium]